MLSQSLDLNSWVQLRMYHLWNCAGCSVIKKRLKDVCLLHPSVLLGCNHRILGEHAHAPISSLPTDASSPDSSLDAEEETDATFPSSEKRSGGERRGLAADLISVQRSDACLRCLDPVAQHFGWVSYLTHSGKLHFYLSLFLLLLSWEKSRNLLQRLLVSASDHCMNISHNKGRENVYFSHLKVYLSALLIIWSDYL